MGPGSSNLTDVYSLALDFLVRRALRHCGWRRPRRNCRPGTDSRCGVGGIDAPTPEACPAPDRRADVEDVAPPMKEPLPLATAPLPATSDSAQRIKRTERLVGFRQFDPGHARHVMASSVWLCKIAVLRRDLRPRWPERSPPAPVERCRRNPASVPGSATGGAVDLDQAVRVADIAVQNVGARGLRSTAGVVAR